MDEKNLDELSQKLNRLILMSRIKYFARADRDLKELSLTESSVRLLQYINILKKCSIAKASQMLMATPSFTSKIVRDLQKLRLIKKAQSVKDKREVFIKLTVEGIKTVKKIIDYDVLHRKAILQRIAQKCGESKLHVLSEIVNSLLSDFGKEI